MAEVSLQVVGADGILDAPGCWSVEGSALKCLLRQTHKIEIVSHHQIILAPCSKLDTFSKQVFPTT